METLETYRDPSEIFQDIQTTVTRPVDAFVASNGQEQQRLFLSGQIDAPVYTYDKLAKIGFAEVDQHLEGLGKEIAIHPGIDPKHKSTYAQYVEGERLKNRFLQVTFLLGAEDIGEAGQQLETEYQSLNECLYGGLDKGVFTELLADKISLLWIPERTDPKAAAMYDELQSVLPDAALDEQVAKPYRPSPETVDAVRRFANVLYGQMLEYAPDRDEPYANPEVVSIFRQVLNDEFGGAANGWEVEPGQVKATHVNAGKKRIYVPKTGKLKTAGEVRGLMAHELGVHLMRSVMGESTDLYTMQVGLPDYLDTEEGLGVLMQQAVKGEYKAGGVYHYIVTGLVESGLSFREAFDIRWRLGALAEYKPGTDITDDSIAAAQNQAYAGVARITRGTGRLAWHKDLAYYKGVTSMWQYFEQHAGDELMLTMAFLGKLDPTRQNHLRTALETRTI